MCAHLQALADVDATATATATAASHEVRRVMKVVISECRDCGVPRRFDPGHDLVEHILGEQSAGC